MNILLVNPIKESRKSKNNWDHDPVALRRLGVLLESQGHSTRLVSMSNNTLFPEADFIPDQVWVSLTFTYRFYEMMDAVINCSIWYPGVKFVIGGPAISLLEDSNPGMILKAFRDAGIYNDIQIWTGLYPGADDIIVPWDKLGLQYSVLTASRGCPRKCSFCGTHIIEKGFNYKPISQVLSEIRSNNVVFTDNNILARPDVEEFLEALSQFIWKGKIVYYEFQSGLDYRYLTQDMERGLRIAKLIRKARVKIPRLAWDLSLGEINKVKAAFDLLFQAGYRPKDVFCFVLFNADMTFEQIEKKRRQLLDWGVRIADCRLRPLSQLKDNYNPRTEQNGFDYHISRASGWTDAKIKAFRKNCRSINILLARNLNLDAPLEDVLYYKKRYSVPDQVMREFGFTEYLKAFPNVV